MTYKEIDDIDTDREFSHFSISAQLSNGTILKHYLIIFRTKRFSHVHTHNKHRKRRILKTQKDIMYLSCCLAVLKIISIKSKGSEIKSVIEAYST